MAAPRSGTALGSDRAVASLRGETRIKVNGSLHADRVPSWKEPMDSSDNRSSSELPARVFLVEDNPEDSFIAVRVLHQLLGEGSEIIISFRMGTRSAQLISGA